MKDPDSELFNYTVGRFLINNAYNLQQRSRVFDIPGLFSIIAKAMDCKTDQIIDFKKIKDGSLNRLFLVTLDTNTQLVVRIPYPLLVPKSYTIASEVATMDFLRSKGLPIPKVYAYSFTADNEANTEYILMEYAKGTDLSDIWHNLKEDQIASLMKQIAQLESNMMSIPFPAGGSIYYAKDLKELSGKEGIPIEQQQNESDAASEKARFCIGPDISRKLWYGRREQLDVFRGPYKDAESVVVAGAKKELAYLDKFGTPRLPLRQHRREAYGFKKQSPLDHATNLKHYLLLAHSLLPRDPSMNAFCIRHPNLTENNIRVTFTGSSDAPSGLKIASLMDWQHTLVLPLFLQAGMPDFVSKELKDNVLKSMTATPALPEGFEKLSEEEQEEEMDLLRRRRVHFYYTVAMMLYNKTNHKGFVYPLGRIRRKTIAHASDIWEGETIELLCALMEIVQNWNNALLNWGAPVITIEGEGNFYKLTRAPPPCPVAFSPEEVRAALQLYNYLDADREGEQTLRRILGCGPFPDAWVPAVHYDKIKALAKLMKQEAMTMMSEEPLYDELKKNWPLEDFDEKEYL
ncbi:hypothetical protein CPC08DRAFT_757730 [Agrocybe pediades]|nr:hypothetical protein CPC08DRAFT_757730 [Agrocybe pediades]